jgi:hypothetical protein
MEIYKDNQILRIDYKLWGNDYEIYAEIYDHTDEIYIEGLDGFSIPLEVMYTFTDWVQEKTRRPKKKYRITYVTSKYPSYVPEDAVIEEVYEKV